MTLHLDSATHLSEYIADQSDGLLQMLRVYILRMGIASATENVDGMAAELLNDVVVEALDHAARFDPSQSPRAWLLGIAINLVKRRRNDILRRDRREPLLHDLYTEQDRLSDEELFDQLVSVASNAANPAFLMEANAEIVALLEGVSPDDQAILRLSILHGLDGDAIAHELDISPGTARVRLHRAIRRLKAVHQAKDNHEDSHAK
jgi:RNA polymerase sigma factor (sigma-70 family)